MKRLTATILSVGILLIALLVWWNNGVSAVNPTDTTPQLFVIRPGEGIRQIASSLKNKGLIKDPTVFFLQVKQLGLDGKIQAGSFRLSPSMSTTQIAQALTHGTLDIWITIPEGKRAEEIATLLKGKMPSYEDSWEATLVANEGFLFPDTYLLPRDATIDTIVTTMKGNFDKKYSQVSNATTLSQQQIVTLASLIEREAKHDADRPMVSSVIHNRLEAGMAIDIDATIQYAVGYDQNEKTWWKKGLTLDDLAINSPYNTYKNVGLPPGPIANPGLEALIAAANPAKTSYYFYLSDKNGQNHYAKTNAEHEANKEKYGL